MLRQRGVVGLILAALALVAVVAVPARAPVASAQAPDCLVGTWGMTDTEGYLRALNTLVGQNGVAFEFSNVTGSATLTIAPDGTYEVRYDQFTATVSSLGINGTFTFGGTLRGVFRETEPGYLAGSVTESQLSVSINLGFFSNVIPLDFTTPESEPRPYTCDGGQLSVSISTSSTSNVQVAFTRAP
jgi:hypothetical protein